MADGLARRALAHPAALAAGALVAGALAFADVPVLGRVAGVVVLALPGVLAARLAGRGQRLDRYGRVTLATGLGLACVVGVGLLLTVLHAVHPRGWATGLTVLSLLLVVAGAAAPGRPADTRAARAPVPGARLLGAAAAAAAVLVAVAVAVSVHTARSEDSLPFTALSLRVLPGDRLEIQVRNENPEREAYTLELSSPARTVRSWRLVLDPGGVTTVTDSARSTGRLTARLHRIGDPAPVTREVWLEPGDRDRLARDSQKVRP